MTAIPPGPVPPQVVPEQPPQGPPMITPPQGVVPPRIPTQQTDTQGAQMGSDAPPSLGGLAAPQGAVAPPAWDGWLPPMQLPGNHSEQQMIIDRMRQEWQLFQTRRQHQGDIDIMQGVQDAPGQAEQLMRDIRMKPDEDFSQQLSQLEGSLPPSRAQHLRASHDRIRSMRGAMEGFGADVEKKLQSDFTKDVTEKDFAKRKKSRMDEREARLRAHFTGGKQIPEAELRKLTSEIVPDYAFEKSEAPVGLSDIKRGLGSIVTGDESVEDAMLRTLRTMLEKRLPTGKSSMPGEQMADFAKEQFGLDPSGSAQGFSRETWRAAFTDVAIRKVGEMKRDTSTADVVGQAAAALPWVASGMGEIAISAKVVQGLTKTMPWLSRTGKLGEITGKAMTYAGGPALMEFSYGMTRDLPGTRQAELDTITDPKRKAATNTAFRLQQATLDATMAVAFSIADVARAARSSPLLRHIADNPGKVMTDAAKLGLVAPAAAEGTNVLIGEAATAMAANEGEAADVLRDLYAAKGMYGPIQQFMDATSQKERVAAAKEYGKQMLPMMAGVAGAHAMTGLGVKFLSRKDMLEGRRAVEADIAKLDIDDEAKAAFQRVMDQELEALAPSKREDKRARDQATVEALHGEAAPSRVMAERLADEVLADVPGKNVEEKIDAIRAGDDPAKTELADKLDELRTATDRGVADQLVGEVRRLAGDDRPLDVVTEDGRLQDAISQAEDPIAADAALTRAAESAETEWTVVSRNADDGTVTVRQDRPGEAPIRRTIPEAELPSYRLAEPDAPRIEGAEAPPPRPRTKEFDEWFGGSKVVDDSGGPLKVFHETRADFKGFRRGAESDYSYGDAGDSGGFFFFSDASGTSLEGVGKGSRTIPAYLSIRNPAEIPTGLSLKEQAARLHEAQAQGHDGAHIDGQWVVFSPDQIKSTIDARTLAETPPVRPESEGLPILDDATNRAVQAMRAGATSGRKLAEALSVSRHRAGQILKGMHEQGMLVKKGRGYELAPEAGEGMLRESDARDDESRQITDRLLGDAATIAREFGTTGDSTSLSERAGRMANDIADYGDIVRPDDPQVASAELASRVMLELPPDARTDDVIRQLGMGKTDIPIVREMMKQRENPAPIGTATSSLTPEVMGAVEAVLEGRTRLDKAMKEPTTEGLPADVRMTYEEAIRAGSADAAEQAWAVWRDANPEAPERPLSSEIARHSKHLEELNRDVVSLDPKRHETAVTDIADLVGGIRESDEWTGLLSLDESGRAYLQRLNALWHGLTVKREVSTFQGITKAKTDADRKRKVKKIMEMRREGERGSVPVLAPAVILVAPAIAAYAVMRAGFRTMGKVWRQSFRLVGKTLRALKWPASKLVNMWQSNNSAIRQAARYEQRAAAALSKNVGKRGGGTGIIDNQTLWGEIDLAMAYERAAFYSKVAHEATNKLNKVIKEDSSFDHDINRALEIMGTPMDSRKAGDSNWLDSFEMQLTEPQRDVVDGIREMYGSLRQLVAGELLPTQQQRRRDIRLLDDLVKQSKVLEESLRSKLGEGDKKTQKAADRAHKKALDKVEAAQRRADRLRTEGSREKARWGITGQGFAPAVPSRDPAKAMAEARAEGKLSEAEFSDIDVQQALRDLATTSTKLKDRAHDFIHSEIPPAPRAGHWMHRKGTLEAAGAREQSSVRSFFHYVKEVYRLMPAAQWHERHYENLWGTEKWVSMDELNKGKLDGGGQVVEFISDRTAPSARRRTHWRMAGSGFGLKLEGPSGSKQTVWFRTYDDWKSARAAEGTAILGEGWSVAEQQLGAKHHLLVHHEARPGAEMPLDAVKSDKKTKRLLLPEHDLKAVLPTNAVGSYVKKVGGKYAAIRRMSGKKTASEFAAYIDQQMQRMMGRELLTKKERVGAGFSAIIRHKLLGMLQLSSAIKESMDNFLATAIHSGVEGAMDATYYALEFSRRLKAAEKKIGKLGTSDWLKQHTPTQKGEILPQAILDGVLTSKRKLDKMSPADRQEAEWMDDAFTGFLKSALSGDSISEHLGVVQRQGGYGQKLFLASGAQEPGIKGQAKHVLEVAGRIGGALGDASWYLRRRAQSYGMRMTWLGSYMAQRKAGKTDSQAVDISNRFALAQGNVGNRVTQGEVFQTWYGRIIKPLASWSLATSSSNIRQLFQHTGGVRVVALTAAKRLGYFAAQLYMLEQVGMLFELDLGNSLGGKVSQIPVVGPMAAYSTQQLIAKMELAADPADPSRELPEWRRKLIAQARKHAPDWLREYLVRRGATIGGYPADIPIPMIAGTWSPYVADAARDFYTIWTTPDDKKRAYALHNLGGANFDWMRAWNRLYKTTPDPSDPNYLLIKNPQTGHMQQRVRKGEEGAAIWNLLMPDLETSVRRMERGILQPRRDELRAATSRNVAFHAQKHLIEADKLSDQMAGMQSAEQRAVTQGRIKALKKKFNQAVLDYSKERELNLSDTFGVYKRWEKTAKASMALTGRERDIINAYDTDSAFGLWSAAMDDVSDPMTKIRFEKVMGLRYATIKSMFVALAKQRKSTVERFMSSYATARARWSIDKR